jgi:hypothetical protein
MAFQHRGQGLLLREPQFVQAASMGHGQGEDRLPHTKEYGCLNLQIA